MTTRETMEIPLLEEVVRDACAGFGAALVELDYPNGGIRDGIFHENNIIAYLAHELLNRSFHCYAEAHVKGGRVDLLASDLQTAFVIEAKKFGNIGVSEGALSDVLRIRDFRAKGSTPDNGWWDRLRQRWGVMVIGCQRPSARLIEEAWCTDSEGAAREAIQRRTRGREKLENFNARNEAFLTLWSGLRELSATVGVEPICSAERLNTSNSASLLWAAFQLR